MMRCCFLLAIAAAAAASAQWTLQDSHTTASLRGVHYTGHDIAWASGTNGTVIRTLDGGRTWRSCAIPPDADKLDFRGVQAFDATTAVIMSSGTGALSRIYKTTDGCKTWKLLFTNPDAEGFWDALQFSTPDTGMLIGDPVNSRFAVFSTTDGGSTWRRRDILADSKNQSIFAASNSSLLVDPKSGKFWFLTGGGRTTIFEGDTRAIPSWRSASPLEASPWLHGGKAPSC